jgi:lipopolysaccharide transport system permease protein
MKLTNVITEKHDFERQQRRISSKPSMYPEFISWQVSRDLLFNLIYLDLIPKYKTLWKGCTWSIIQPFLIALVAAFSLRYKIVNSLDPFDYFLCILSGLVPWFFFSNGFVKSAFSLTHKRDWIRKVYAPKLILIVASVTSCLLDFFISTIFLLVCTLILRGPSQIHILPLFFYIFTAWLLLIGLGLWFSSLTALHEDTRFAVPFLQQLYFFSTPILYSEENLPKFLRHLEIFNPMALVVNGFRSSFLGGEKVGLTQIVASFATILIILSTGFIFFQIKDRKLPELL